MTKRRPHPQQQKRHSVPYRSTTKKRVITYGIIGVIISSIGIFGYRAMTPANSSTPYFGIPNNHFIKARYSPSSGYSWISMSSGSVKGLRGSGGGSGITNPHYVLHKGDLQSIHVINEDYETHSKHNFNVDELNIHTNDLDYYGTQTITFVADKPGTFHYYCTIHPEMRGDITVE
jgi:hypothetical protein